MSGFANGSIILDEDRNVYYAGQVLSGRIEFALSQPLVFRVINVEFHGEATVNWAETEIEEYEGYRRQITQEYSANEDYFHVVQCVCGGVGVSQLSAGSHSIPFRYQIPPTAPSYFEGKEGSVSYYVKACLEYPDGREADELEEAFEVVVPLDLNANPAMKQPICMELEEIVSSFCCGSGPLAVQVKLPASGFCPGQAIPIEINANNQSSAEVHSIKLQLIRRDGYRSTNPPSDQYPPPDVMLIHWLGAILPHTKRTISTEMIVPDMIAPVLDNCSIINVEFYFTVKLKLSGCNDFMEDEAQIYLGFVPIAELVNGQYKHPMEHDLPSGPIPDLNAPNQFIQPYVYPSITLENKLQNVHVQNATNYPGSNAYPGNPPYPGNAPYPTNGPSNAPYPGASPGYPGANAPYPGNPPPPGASPPYPGVSPPYPGVSPPYPVANPPYPHDKPNNLPYPTNPPPFAPSPAGFKIPAESPGYPMGSVTSSPYNPSAPPSAPSP